MNPASSAVQRRQFLGQLSGATLTLLAVNGCGTILHPERKGQAAGPLDWKIVALDAVGLLFFFVPGVIAFAVDFNNGTIYLPSDYHSSRSSRRKGELKSIPVSRSSLTLTGVEQVVSREVKQDVRLNPGGYQTHALSKIDEFWTQRDHYEELARSTKTATS